MFMPEGATNGKVDFGLFEKKKKSKDASVAGEG